MTDDEARALDGFAVAETAEPQNWARAVSIGDLFMLLLKFSVAAVPFVIGLMVLLPFLVSASLAFFAGATGSAR